MDTHSLVQPKNGAYTITDDYLVNWIDISQLYSIHINCTMIMTNGYFIGEQIVIATYILQAETKDLDLF